MGRPNNESHYGNKLETGRAGPLYELFNETTTKTTSCFCRRWIFTARIRTASAKSITLNTHVRHVVN